MQYDANVASEASSVLGLVSDTHGVYDPQLSELLQHASLILHAGDVGHHGLHTEVLAQLRHIAPVLAVRGNVDDCASTDELPEVRIETFNGWRILVTHIVGMPPKVAPTAKAMLAEHKPDIVIFGHSHVYGEQRADGVWYINPGAAGPARFKLSRTAALLHLPANGLGESPHLQRLDLAGKAPPRCKPGDPTAEAQTQQRCNVSLKRKRAQSQSSGSRKRRK